MSLCIVYYCPSAGGNHLKNLINLAPEMAEHESLNLDMYFGVNHYGTAHSRAGRNVQEVELRQVMQEPDRLWCVCGHFGELAPKKDILMQIPNRKIIMIGIESPNDRWLLEIRQERLGQKCHSYWLNEEQPYLYDREMCTEYWRTFDTLKIALEHFWNPDLRFHQIIDQINRFLSINIPFERADEIHRRWWSLNFQDPRTVDFYGKHLPA